jgi:Protein of unknown function (DUF3352)
MTSRRIPLLRRALPACAALALVGLVLAGCGSSDKAAAVAGAAGTDGRAAQAFPASTVAFLDANIDETSTAWKQLLTLARRFPSWSNFAAGVEKEMSDETGDDSPTVAQLRSWLGTEAAIGVLDVPTDGSDPTFLAFAEVRDRAQLEAALKKESDTRVLGKHGDFDLFGSDDNSVVAISADTALLSNRRAPVDAAIDRLGGTGDKLSDVSAFQDTLASLATDNILVAYAPGSVLPKLVALGRRNDPTDQTKNVSQGQFDQIIEKLGDVRSLGFSFGATDKGLRIRGTTILEGDAGDRPAAYAPELLSRVPAGSWFAASFRDLGTSAKSGVDQALGANPDAKQQVTQVESVLGIKLDDVYALLAGEHALYAGPGAPVSAGLILHPPDPERGASTLRALTKLLIQQGIKFEDTADGQSAAIQGFAARWRTVDDVIGIGTDTAVGNAVKDSIVDSDKFKNVLAEDGVSSDAKTLGLAYIDVPSLVNLANAFGNFENDPSNKEAFDNLKHIGGVLFWTGADGDTVTSDLFVEST